MFAGLIRSWKIGRAIARLKTTRDVPDHLVPEATRAALADLEAIGGPAVVRALVEFPLASYPPVVICAVLNALGRLGDPAGIPAAVPFLTIPVDGFGPVRDAAGRALKALGWEPQTPAEREAFVIANREPCGKAESEKVYMPEAVVEMVGRDAAPRMSEAIRAVNELLPGGMQFVEVGSVLLRSRVAPAPALVAAIARIAAAGTLTPADERLRSAVRGLVEVLFDALLKPGPGALDWKNWPRAWELLTALGVRELVAISPDLVAGLSGVVTGENIHDSQREQVVVALGQFGGVAAVPALIQALAAKDSSTRTAAVDALWKLGDPRAVEPLLDNLRRSRSYEHMRTIEALGALRDRRALQPLIARLADWGLIAVQALDRIDPEWRAGVAREEILGQLLARLSGPKADGVVLTLDRTDPDWPNHPRLPEFIARAAEPLLELVAADAGAVAPALERLLGRAAAAFPASLLSRLAEMPDQRRPVIRGEYKGYLEVYDGVFEDVYEESGGEPVSFATIRGLAKSELARRG